MDQIKLILQLGDALKAASAHLDYCGYGDRWERECAEAENLENKIDEALGQFEAFNKSRGGK